MFPNFSWTNYLFKNRPTTTLVNPLGSNNATFGIGGFSPFVASNMFTPGFGNGSFGISQGGNGGTLGQTPPYGFSTPPYSSMPTQQQQGQQIGTTGFATPPLGEESGFLRGRPGTERTTDTTGQSSLTAPPSNRSTGGRIPGYVLDEHGNPFSPTMYLSEEQIAERAEAKSLSYDSYVELYIEGAYFWNPKLGQYQFAGEYTSSGQQEDTRQWWEKEGFESEKKANQYYTDKKRAEKDARDRENPRKNGQFAKNKSVGVTTATSFLGTG